MQTQTLNELIGPPLKKIGILISRISLGTPIGLVYVELRQRENDELAVEMYTNKGQSIDPLKLIGSPPPAFCSKFSNTSPTQISTTTTTDPTSIDYNRTTQDISYWINKSKLNILGFEFSGLNRDYLNKIELDYVNKFNAEKIGREIFNDLRYNGKSLWISSSVIDSWDTDENLVYEYLGSSVVCERGKDGVRITTKSSFMKEDQF